MCVWVYLHYNITFAGGWNKDKVKFYSCSQTYVYHISRHNEIKIFTVIDLNSLYQNKSIYNKDEHIDRNVANIYNDIRITVCMYLHIIKQKCN